MQRGLVLSVLAILFLSGCVKNSSTPVNPTPGDKSDVFVCGSEKISENSIRYRMKYWKNDTAYSLEADTISYVSSIYVTGDSVFVGGYINSGIAANTVAAYWLNGVMHTLSSPDKMAAVNSITVHNGDVYATGYLKNSSGFLDAVYWKNGVLTILPSNGFSAGYKILVSGSDVYVCGSYGYNAAIWKNAVLTTLSTKQSTARDMFIDKDGSVICVGSATNDSSYSEATYWKNSAATVMQVGSSQQQSYGMAIGGNSNGDYEICYFSRNGISYAITGFFLSSNGTTGTIQGRQITPTGVALNSSGDTYTSGYETVNVNGKQQTNAAYWKNESGAHYLTDGSLPSNATGIFVTQ